MNRKGGERGVSTSARRFEALDGGGIDLSAIIHDRGSKRRHGLHVLDEDEACTRDRHHPRSIAETKHVRIRISHSQINQGVREGGNTDCVD